MMPPVGRQIRIDGEPMMLSPGAQIRDVRNRIVQPMVLTRPVPVRYTMDLAQQVRRVWILTPEENRGARAMLTAAAATYVAATIAAVVQLLYWAWRLGLLGGRRD